MAGVVDRLLAQLPGLQGEPIPSRPVSRSNTSYAASPPRDGPSPRQWLGVWIRVLLGFGLGVTMSGWPYLHSCGMSLVGYLSAVVTVILTGLWAATSAWRYRIALAHVVALVVVLYGVALITAELLPRTGYAVDHAGWQCDDAGSGLPWSAAVGSQSVRISA
jgi:hypothetical protein